MHRLCSKNTPDQRSFFEKGIAWFFKNIPKRWDSVDTTVNGETKIGGKFWVKLWWESKSATKLANTNDHKTVSYTISVNRKQNKDNIKEVTIERPFEVTNASYVPDSIKVLKGKFSLKQRMGLFSDALMWRIPATVVWEARMCKDMTIICH